MMCHRVTAHTGVGSYHPLKLVGAAADVVFGLIVQVTQAERGTVSVIAPVMGREAALL